jgi:hypothetical protein
MENIMANGFTLPALNIRAVAPAFSSSTLGLAPPMPNPAVAVAAQHPLRLQMYAEGYWREMIIKHMEEVIRQTQNGWRYNPTAELSFDLLKVPLADKYMSLNPHALSTDAVREALSGWGFKRKISEARELSGGILTPFSAWSHYLDGSGADVTTHLTRLGLNLSATKIPALESAFASAIVGTSPINLPKVAYNTGQDSYITWAWLGNITLRIEGTVHKSHDGRVSFDGAARAYNDTYDFNASNHRSEIGEAATSGGRLLDSIKKGKPYQVIIQGELPISIQR